MMNTNTIAAIDLLRNVAHQSMTTEARCILYRAAHHLSHAPSGLTAEEHEELARAVNNRLTDADFEANSAYATTSEKLSAEALCDRLRSIRRKLFLDPEVL